MAKADGSASDGFHTFDELYEHRTVLFAALCSFMPNGFVTRSLNHHPDDPPMYAGMFLAICHLPTGDIAYHVDDKYWSLFDNADSIEYAPKWDGHTADDTLDRLRRWIVEWNGLRG